MVVHPRLAAEEVGTSVRSVYEAIRQLKDAGLISGTRSGYSVIRQDAKAEAKLDASESVASDAHIHRKRLLMSDVIAHVYKRLDMSELDKLEELPGIDEVLRRLKKMIDDHAGVEAHLSFSFFLAALERYA